MITLRHITTLFASAVLYSPVAAQTTRPLGIFHDLIGQWEGSAWYDMGPGGRQQVRQRELVEAVAGGTVIAVKGLGTMSLPNGTSRTVHDAYAVVHRDHDGRAALMRAFTAEGRWMDMELTIRDNGYTWTMNDPRAGKIRYEMALDAQGRWIESGWRQQGAESVKFFEMTLTRK